MGCDGGTNGLFSLCVEIEPRLPLISRDPSPNGDGVNTSSPPRSELPGASAGGREPAGGRRAARSRTLSAEECSTKSRIALLSLFPFFLLAFSILGSVTANVHDRTAILDFVLRYFPRQFEFVTSQLDALQQARIRLGVAGSLLMIWAAMGVFSAITSAINHAWGVERQPSYFKHKLMAFIMLVAASLLLLGGLLLVSAINVIEAKWFAVVLCERRVWRSCGTWRSSGPARSCSSWSWA